MKLSKFPPRRLWNMRQFYRALTTRNGYKTEEALENFQKKKKTKF